MLSPLDSWPFIFGTDTCNHSSMALAISKKSTFCLQAQLPILQSTSLLSFTSLMMFIEHYKPSFLGKLLLEHSNFQVLTVPVWERGINMAFSRALSQWERGFQLSTKSPWEGGTSIPTHSDLPKAPTGASWGLSHPASFCSQALSQQPNNH